MLILAWVGHTQVELVDWQYTIWELSDMEGCEDNVNIYCLVDIQMAVASGGGCGDA